METRSGPKLPCTRSTRPENPGAFDFKSYAARKNIIHQLYLKEGSFVLNRGKSSGLPVASARLNQNLQRVMERALRQPREQAIAKALLLGDRNDIPEELLDRFKGAGAMHILAISGLHVGIIQLLLTFLTRPLRLLRWGRVLSMILVVTGLWGYALLTGMAVSSIRAVSMFTLLTIGQSVRRRSGMLNNLSNSAFVLLLFNPLYLLDVGFQLSYSALIGIGLGSGIMKKRKRQGTKKTRLRKYFFGLVQVSCAAQIGVMPMSLLYFNQFSGLFLVSSLILLPVLGSTLLFGYSVLIAASFFDLPSLVSKGLELWMGIIVKSINWLGGIDELIFEGVYFPLEFCFLTGAGLVMLTQAAARKKPVYLGISGFCLICMQLIWIHQRIELVRTEELMVFHIRGESLVVLRKGPVLHLKELGAAL
jgi:competence protein ComEC